MIRDDEREDSWWVRWWPGLVPIGVLGFAVGGAVHLGLLIARWIYG